MSIKFKLGSIITGLSLIICLMFMGTVYTTTAQKSDSLVINLAGRQRMLSQKMVKELLSFVAAGRNEKLGAGVKNTMKVFDMTLDALINSGKAPLSLNLEETAYGICPKPEGPAVSQLATVKKTWNLFSQHMDTVLSDAQNAGKSLIYINDNNIRLLKEMNAVVGMMQAMAEKK